MAMNEPIKNQVSPPLPRRDRRSASIYQPWNEIETNRQSHPPHYEKNNMIKSLMNYNGLIN